MSSALAARSAAPAPPLLDGERLGRAEFLRRWEAEPDLKQAERIEGVVHAMASPVAVREHAQPALRLGARLADYADRTPGTFAYGNGTTLIDLDNDFQPDAALIVLPERGGQTSWRGKFLAGAPEFVAEVAHSTAGSDLGAKKNVYRRNGTREYLVWRTGPGVIDVFALDDNGEFQPAPLAEGVWRSVAFPGLWLHVAGLLAGDHSLVADTAAAGLATPEHAAFVAALAAAKS